MQVICGSADGMQVNLIQEGPMMQLAPECCAAFMCEESEHKANVPFNKKHAVQFASIVGHLERVGTITDSGQCIMLIFDQKGCN
jgi:hypothetical protein